MITEDEYIVPHYDKKAIFKYLFLAVVTIAFWRVTLGFGAILATLLIISAIRQDKPIQMLFWVLFITLSAAGNRQIFTTNIASVLIVRITLMMLTIILASRLAGRGHGMMMMTPFWGIMAYICWEYLISYQGFQPTVSYLKLILFTCVFLSMFGVTNMVNRSMRTDARMLRASILALMILILFGSVLIIPIPSLSLMVVDENILEAMLLGDITSLFRGMTAHSQVMGPMAGVMGTFLFADLAFSIRKWDKLYLALLICCPILIYKSSSRTGMGTFIAGIGMTIYLIMKAKGLGAQWKGKLVGVFNVLMVICAIAVIVVPSMRNKISGFILKWDKTGEQTLSAESVLSTRQAKIDIALRNFRDKPIQGNGFQVSEDMSYEKREGFISYMIAPIEKGVWVYAILEEGGVVGFVLFSLWLIVLFRLLIERHAYIGACVFFAFLTANLGEFSMFSMTYVGGFYWMLVFAAICLDVQRMKSEDLPVFMYP